MWCQYPHYTQASAYKTPLPLCQGALGFLLEKTCSHVISPVRCSVDKDVDGWYCNKTCIGSSSSSSKLMMPVVQHGLVSKIWFVSLDLRLALISEQCGIYAAQLASATLILLLPLFGVSSGLPLLPLVTMQWFCLWETSPLLVWGTQTVLAWGLYVHTLEPFLDSFCYYLPTARARKILKKIFS